MKNRRDSSRNEFHENSKSEKSEKSPSNREKIFFFGEESDAEDTAEKNFLPIVERDPPRMIISEEMKKSTSSQMDPSGLKIKSVHGSWPNFQSNSNYGQREKEFFSPSFKAGGNESDSVGNSNRSEKKLLEEDYRNVIRVANELQKVVKTISDKYEKLISAERNGKQLNFRSRDDIINGPNEFSPAESAKVKKELRLVIRPDPQERMDDLNFHCHGRNQIKNQRDTLSTDSSQFFLENERLLNGKWNAFLNLRCNDANSVTSPFSTVPESTFESGKKCRNQNLVFPKRSVLKNGQCNVLKKSSNSKRRIRYLQDIFTTLVDVKWRWTLVVFALSFIMSWLFYAGIYWLIAYAHGDFEHLEDEHWTPCVENLFNFASCFLFSVETQHTIGYGGRATNEECPEAIFVMCMQSITGVMISAFLAGIFFAKMSRPKQRRQTLLFSRKAVICQRDTQLCMMFRVGDMRKSHIIGTNIRAHIFQTRTTREGEELPQYQCELKVSADGCESNMFFIWPLTIIHVIDKNSPLYNLSAQELLREDFEIVAILEGTVESTGQTTQARTSYLPTEIKWGHRFESVLSYNNDRQCYEIDYKKFNNTSKVATPLCSAKDLNELFMVQSEICEYNIMNSDPDTDDNR